LADSDLLEQVLINLVLNAADAVKDCQNPRVDMIASLDDRGRPVIQVRDNGTGIAPENLDRVFVPFFSTKEGGSGIGLALSRQIMRLHHGSISAASKPGETVFTLRFKL
jgi:two-component system nitrogen regulation sensor histidine kinase NtrY